VLYIFCDTSIWKLVGTSATNFQIVNVTKSLGCQAPDSIKEIGGDVLFLGPDGIRPLSGTERIGDVEVSLLSRQVQPLVRDLIETANENSFSALTIPSKSQYRIFKYEAGITSSDATGLLGKLEPRDDVGNLSYSWALLKGIYQYSSASGLVGNTEAAVFGDPSSGYVYRLESGNDFDGVSIPHVYRTPYFIFDDAVLRKVMHKITVYAQSEGDIQTNLKIIYDFENNDVLQPSPQVVVTESGAAKYGTAVYGTAVYSSTTKPVIKKNLIGSGFNIAFEFSDNNMVAPYTIDSFEIQYALKGRR
jgi:hypothetical protein